MRCPQLQRLSSRFLDGDLGAERASAARGHLRDCERCQRAVAAEAEIVAAARSLPSSPEPAQGWDVLWGRVSARVAEEERADAARSAASLWWRENRSRLTLAVSAGAAFAFVLWGAPALPALGPGPLGLVPGSSSGGDQAVTEGGPERDGVGESLAERGARERAETDRQFREAVSELEVIIAEEQAFSDGARADAAGAELGAIRERVRGAKAARVALPDTAGRPSPRQDPVYEAYWEELATLQRAAVGVSDGEPGAGFRQDPAGRAPATGPVTGDDRGGDGPQGPGGARDSAGDGEGTR